MDIKKSKSNLIIGFIFLIGIIFRFFVFGNNSCYVHDDAALAINVVNKSYLQFFLCLDNWQIAPPVFMILSKLIYNIVPKDYQIIDFYLKIIPFLSALISIPLFYIFSKLLFQERAKIYIANLLFALNPLLVCFSGRFKQYSTEVVIALILYIIIRKYMSEGIWKKYWYFIIFIAPWCSISSMIVLFSGLIIVFLKNKQIDRKVLYSVLGSVTLFLVVYLPSKLQLNYAEMHNFWSQYGFMSFIHPQRFLLRLGELFIQEQKIIKTFFGFLVLYKMIEYFIKDNYLCNKIFVSVPIFVTISLSFMHLYPFADRLIAFLVPLFIVIMTEYSNNIFSKLLSINFILISLFGLSISISEIYSLPNYRNNPAQYLNDDNIHAEYKPFYPVYKWYTHLD